MLERNSDRSDELQLLGEVLEGDPRAAERFVARYRGTVELCVQQVLRRAGARAEGNDVEDLVHEIWLAIFEGDKRCLRRFEPERQIRVSTWIGLLSRNKAVDRLRQQSARRRLLRLADPQDLPEAPTDTPSPRETLERRERRALAQAAFERLREDEQRFLLAWYRDERPPEQLAAELGVAVGTVYTRRYKLQQKLAKALSRVVAEPLRLAA